MDRISSIFRNLPPLLASGSTPTRMMVVVLVVSLFLGLGAVLFAVAWVLTPTPTPTSVLAKNAPLVFFFKHFPVVEAHSLGTGRMAGHGALRVRANRSAGGAAAPGCPRLARGLYRSFDDLGWFQHRGQWHQGTPER